MRYGCHESVSRTGAINTILSHIRLEVDFGTTESSVFGLSPYACHEFVSWTGAINTMLSHIRLEAEFGTTAPSLFGLSPVYGSLSRHVPGHDGLRSNIADDTLHSHIPTCHRTDIALSSGKTWIVQ